MDEDDNSAQQLEDHRDNDTHNNNDRDNGNDIGFNHNNGDDDNWYELQTQLSQHLDSPPRRQQQQQQRQAPRRNEGDRE
eukprot:CAMPEP_0113317542 /NCGR_PEP_ID=MMETSP0010_2-20120614/12408_1 /TAXON_ID=216773 ORGANISM="Corethron hystrix, Strain 308" /NCGR_SAMPLE_ID=MMETSP0010_2 /ASSEMBLY_ACC=CAM_ASM_000155 /LENGTH=78 /DNA_ID=CAMNT_0000174543 /DNA_START=162 /DNA_END=398 /DNA_ORIENTATION=- /assembly_acc=CAM_ASM_000155